MSVLRETEILQFHKKSKRNQKKLFQLKRKKQYRLSKRKSKQRNHRNLKKLRKQRNQKRELFQFQREDKLEELLLQMW